MFNNNAVNIEQLRRKCLVICCANSAEEYYNKMGWEFDRPGYMGILQTFSTDDLAELLEYQIARVESF